MSTDDLRKKYGNYSVGQIKLVMSNKAVAQEVKDFLQTLLDEKDAPKAEAKSEPKAKAAKVTKPEKAEKPAAEKKEPVAKKEKVVKAEKAPKEPKEKVQRTNENDDWAFDVDDVVKFKMASNSKVNPGEVVEGTITKRFEFKGYKEYRIKVGNATMTKRQNTLLEQNA